MGNCIPIEDSYEVPVAFDDFYYIYRNLRYLLRISDNGIHKLKYDNSIKIRKDSGVGYLNDGRIMLVGGTDNSGCLTNKAYILDPAKNKATILPNLPISVKEGYLFHFKDFVYVIGALKDSDDEEILSQEQSAPIMRYYLNAGQWEIFNEEQKKRNFQHMIKKSSKSANHIKDKHEITYKDILYPGCFMIKSKVYMVCGQQMSKRGILETLNLVFSVDLEDESFDFKIEDFEIPLSVFRPICGSYKKKAFITGGVEHSGKHSSKKSLLIDFSSEKPVVETITGLKLDLDDNYPIIASGRNFYCLAFPNLSIFNTEENSWKQFIVDHSFVNKRDVKYQTPVMATDAIGGLASIKNTVKFPFLEKKVKIVDDEMLSGESLSSVDVSVNIKLPPGLVIDGVDDTGKKSKSSGSDSDSSGQFSAERAIDVPEALKYRESEQSSSSSFAKRAKTPNKVVEVQVKSEKKPEKAPKKKKGKKSEESLSQSFSEEGSLYFVEAEGIPKYSESKESSESRSSISKVSSISGQKSSIDLEREVPVFQRPAKNAPVQKLKKKGSNPSFSAESSSSESFEYASDSKSSSSDSRV